MFAKARGAATSGRRLVVPDVYVFDKKLPVMRSHFPVVLPGNGIFGVIGPLLEHLRFLPKYRFFGHGVLPRAFACEELQLFTGVPRQ
jgi:hypothetical protein